MFFIRYVGAELRRRKGRTALTALGLGVGVALVVTVAALSQGLDDAQSEVLEPLTGVGTEMSVSRPIVVEQEGGDAGGEDSSGGFSAGPGADLSAKEQRQLERENEGARIGLTNLGDPGERFTQQDFVSSELSFAAREANRLAMIDGVADVAGALTLNSITVSGEVSEDSGSTGGTQDQLATPEGGVAPAPEAIDFEQSTVSGVDATSPALALVTPDQITEGRYLRDTDRRSAIVSTSYASQNGHEVGDRIDVGGERFEVVGLSSTPLGGESSDVYVPLAELQKLSDREGRINVLRISATDSDSVESVAAAIEDEFAGSEVTTAQDLADRVSGSLVDAQSLSDKLGTALGAVGLIGAVLIASLLTLSSVNKRTRELGTLKAVGWPKRLVVRQIAGESLAQGALGGVAGAVLGVGGAALIGALGISLEASAAAAAEPALGPPGAGSDLATQSTEVLLGAPVDAAIVAVAIALAVAGGLVAGAIGALRAARLRPAEALRSVE